MNIQINHQENAIVAEMADDHGNTAIYREDLGIYLANYDSIEAVIRASNMAIA